MPHSRKNANHASPAKNRKSKPGRQRGDGKSQETRFTLLQQIQHAAYQLAPTIREMFDRAGLAPVDLKTADDLSRLPVFKKESQIDMQRQRPPFGGILAAKDEDIVRIFISPGPINEPQLGHDRDGCGFGTAFAAAGLGPGDRVLNTWSYHLVPAGLVLDEGLRSVGAAVIPAGTGGESQAKLAIDLVRPASAPRPPSLSRSQKPSRR